MTGGDIAGVLRELVMIGGGAALAALVPLAAGAHCATRGAARPRARAHLHGCTPRHPPGPPLAPVYRPYHKFIGDYCYS